MDFIDWCSLVLEKLIAAGRDPHIDEIRLAQLLYGEEFRTAHGFHHSTHRHGMLDAVKELVELGLVEERDGPFWTVRPEGRQFAANHELLWQQIRHVVLEPDEERILRVVNELGPQSGSDPAHAWLEWVKREPLLAEYGITAGFDMQQVLWPVSEDLERRGFVYRRALPGWHLDLKPTYRGLVWARRRDALGEPEMGHVLFIDVVGYSKLPMEQQAKTLQQLQDCVRGTDSFRRAQAANKLISLPTGDGMALVFFGGVTAHINCAIELDRALRQLPELKVRMGVHSGPVYLVVDINTGKNVSGSGINIAQRVMDCGDAGHILMSKAVADVLFQLGGWAERLRDLGEAEVKHGVRVHIFNLVMDDVGNPQPPAKLNSPTTATPQAHGAEPEARLAVDVRHEIEREFDERVDFKLSITLTNVGSVTVRDYRVDIEFPNAFLNQSTGYALELTEKRSATHRFFRVLPKHHRNQELLPEDSLRVFTVDYFNDGQIARSDAMGDELRVKVYSGDRLLRQLVLPMTEIAKFFGP